MIKSHYFCIINELKLDKFQRLFLNDISNSQKNFHSISTLQINYIALKIKNYNFVILKFKYKIGKNISIEASSWSNNNFSNIFSLKYMTYALILI